WGAPGPPRQRSAGSLRTPGYRRLRLRIRTAPAADPAGVAVAARARPARRRGPPADQRDRRVEVRPAADRPDDPEGVVNYGAGCTCWLCFPGLRPLSDQDVPVVEPNDNGPEPAPPPRALSPRSPGQRRDGAGTAQGQPDSPLTRDWDSRDRRDTRRTSWTAAELMATDFPEPRWAVPGLVPEGITLFAGPPKVGKS